MKKRIVSLLLSAMLVLTLLPAGVLAREVSETGECGDNLTWTLYDDGCLEITGSGPMWDYQFNGVFMIPGQRAAVEKVVIEDGVTSIGNYAFWNCQYIAEVEIPESVTAIGTAAFWCARPLTEVRLPQAITRIEEDTFGGCNHLEAVNFPPNLSYIGPNAFSYTDLTEAPLPDSVTEIGQNAFNGCDRLETVTMSDNVTTIGISAFSRCDALKELRLSRSLTEIPDSAFMLCSSLPEIRIPEGVATIGEGAFSACESATYAYIPDSVTAIGDGAFENCRALSDLRYPEGDVELGIGVFSGCTALADEQGLTIVGGVVFNYIGDLDTVTIPEGVTRISSGVFTSGYGGGSVRKVVLSSTVKTLDRSAFSESKVEEVICPEGLETIGRDCFSWCGNLKVLHLPDTVTSIGAYAFDLCENLTDLTLPGDCEIGLSAFRGCEGLKEGDFIIVKGILFDYLGSDTVVDVPEGVTAISQQAFFRDVVDKVNLPDTLTEIHNSAFYECSIKEIDIPGSVTRIGNNAFLACHQLTKVTMGEGLETIGTLAFEDCMSLTEVNLPESLQSIGDYAFTNCPRLKTLTVPGKDTTIGERALGCVGTVISAKPMSDFKLYGPFGAEVELYAKLYSIPFNDGQENPGTGPVTPGHVHDIYGPISGYPATCEGGGQRDIYLCSYCDAMFGDPEGTEELTLQEVHVPPLGHDWGQWETVQEPTATEPGLRRRVCLRDSRHVEEETIQPLGGDDPPDNPENPFTDVKERDYFYNPVLWAVEEGVTAGTSPTTFSPQNPCTRAQVVTFLWRLEGSPEPWGEENPFTDVAPNAYYYRAVQWAVEEEITAGTSATTFSPGEPCTRAQVVSFLWRYMGKPEVWSEDTDFTDVVPTAYYYRSLLWAVESGVTSGTSPTTFSPGATCTRGQIVSFLYRSQH